MISLVKNELTKIFHKKTLYIILIVAIGFMILNLVMTKYFESSVSNYYGQEDLSYYNEMLNQLDKNDPYYKETYTSIKAQLETAKLNQKYNYDSWQWKVVNENSDKYIYPMIEAEGTEKYENAKKVFDTFVQRLENGDWKSFVQAELNDIKNQIEEIEKQEYTPIGISKDIQLIEPNIKKQVLEMRLEKDIPYGSDNKNYILEQWEQSKRDIANYKETEKTKALTYEEKVSKQNAEAVLSLCEYHLKNNLDESISLVDFNQRWNLATEADSDLISSFAGYELFITIAIVVIAGTIISEEFNKGTIKLLLVRPYKRTKVLIAKFIACMVVLFLAYITTVILQLIMGGITNGFGNYIGKAMIYNYKTNAVEEISTIKYLIISGISILPQYILIMTLAFSFSVIFVNSPLAIALPLLGMMGAEIINELAYHYEKAKFLRFFVTPNWKLDIYLFGKLPEFEPISLPFSIAICVIYFVIMIATSTFIFKRKEIKNI